MIPRLSSIVDYGRIGDIQRGGLLVFYGVIKMNKQEIIYRRELCIAVNVENK